MTLNAPNPHSGKETGYTLIDLSGEKFGRLSVVRRATKEEIIADKYPNFPDSKWLRTCLKSARWICVCTCGGEKIILGSNLRNGKTQSCGKSACGSRDWFKAEKSKIVACPQGHAYDDENTIIRKDGRRNCRSCQRLRQRKYNASRQTDPLPNPAPPSAASRP